MMIHIKYLAAPFHTTIQCCNRHQGRKNKGVDCYMKTKVNQAMDRDSEDASQCAKACRPIKGVH